MKKIVFVFTSLFLFAACSSDAEGGADLTAAQDISLEDLKDACGCIDAVNMIADNVLKLVENPEEMSREQERQAMDLMSKTEDIRDYCMEDLDIPVEEFEACDNFKEMSRKMDKLDSM